LGGPYALFYTTGAIVNPNQDFSSLFESIGTVQGLVPRSGRGQVSGTVTGFNAGNKTLHWFNDGYQYWTRPADSGAYTSPLMVPGTYQMVAYQEELRLINSTIVIEAGVTNSVSYMGLANGGPNHQTLWLIGIYDGRPNELQNGGNNGQLRMHPSDARQVAYMPRTFPIGTSYSELRKCFDFFQNPNSLANMSRDSTIPLVSDLQCEQSNHHYLHLDCCSGSWCGDTPCRYYFVVQHWSTTCHNKWQCTT